MSIERTFSKTKAIGNRIVWTNREIIPVAFKLDGVPADGQEFAILRVPGRDMYCNGFRVDFDVPAGDALVSCSLQLFTASGMPVPESLQRLDGVIDGADKVISPPLTMPTKSVWKAVVRIGAPFNDTTYYPQGITFTYHLCYATSPVRAGRFTVANPQVGVGFDEVGLSMEVAPSPGNAGPGPAPLYGTVDPEGVVSARPGATYWNQADNKFWVKDTGEGDTGWQQLFP